ncbi:kinase [Sorangium cellulosum]|jgi:predicted kinase|uniref:Kinase n=1 Tax=Sorangium cellulosum TaxID=56 RepID=A0A4V0NE97_SORCE|nr:AAA family ATPase [Sorangium cellulosum]AUX25412.1 kinase [Sorangium cellulosum]
MVTEESARPELTLVVLMGLQGAGKTSFTRARWPGGHVHVSKDHFPRRAKHKDARQERLIAAALGEGRSVVVDNTHPTALVRAPLVALGRAHGALVVGYCFVARVDECLARNRGRQGRLRVPDVAIFATARRFEAPSLAEGFDELHAVRLVAGEGFEVTAW